jgi:glucan phosphoethanolaminetransferase (alkaline phosphatase superfamily)
MPVIRRLLLACWFGLLLLPVATIAGLANAWETPRWQVVLVSLWIAALLWVTLPPRLFLVLTLPLLWAGIAVFVADVARSANLLELIAVSYTFRPGEVVDALAPYALSILGVGAALLATLAVLWPAVPAHARRREWLAVALVAGAALAFTLPARSWREAWPGSLAGALLEGQAGDAGIALPLLADVRTSPRNRFETWQAHRPAAPPGPETYVLVIGESVRSDRIPGCGGRPRVARPPEDSLTFCDMLAGSSSTHTSVPLLISRALPGSRDRVPRDASLARAFEAVGFETFWFAVQERAIAWPDARNQAYDPTPRLDRDTLLPLLDAALARPEPRKFIVLHNYGAHSPYRERYRPAMAPYPVQGPAVKGEALWNDYDNAIDENMRFLQEVTARLAALPGESFLLFTPDHGENLFDDARQLQHHALKVPTLWDTLVPAVVWASRDWRAAHPGKWRLLSDNARSPVMHMDVAPTLLGAAGIRYQEPRSEPVDLTAEVADPRRPRYTQVRAGETMSFETLKSQAGQ